MEKETVCCNGDSVGDDLKDSVSAQIVSRKDKTHTARRTLPMIAGRPPGW